MAYQTNNSPGGKSLSAVASAVPSIAISNAFTFSQSLTNTSLPETSGSDVNIGEEATFSIAFSLPEATTNSVTLLISSGGSTSAGVMKILTCSVSFGANVYNATAVGQVLTDSYNMALNFGTLVNVANNVANAGDMVTVTLTTLVEDTSANTNSRPLILSSTLSFLNIGSAASRSTTLRIVEPKLTVIKTASPLIADAGDLVTYSITVAHANESTSVAYNLVLVNPLTTFMSADPGSVWCSVPCTVVYGNSSTAGTNITLGMASFALGSSAIVVTFRGRVTDTAVTGSIIGADASLTYWSRSNNSGRTLSATGSGASSMVVISSSHSMNYSLSATSLTLTQVCSASRFSDCMQSPLPIILFAK